MQIPLDSYSVLMSLNLIVSPGIRTENLRNTLLLLLLPLTLNLHALLLENSHASFLFLFNTGSQQINVCSPPASVFAFLGARAYSQLPGMRILHS